MTVPYIYMVYHCHNFYILYMVHSGVLIKNILLTLSVCCHQPPHQHAHHTPHARRSRGFAARACCSVCFFAISLYENHALEHALIPLPRAVYLYYTSLLTAILWIVFRHSVKVNRAINNYATATTTATATPTATATTTTATATATAST